MSELNPVAVGVATVVAFVLGVVYYGLLGDRLARVRGAALDASFPPWKVAVEVGRCLILVLVVAVLAAWAGVDGWAGGLLLGLVLWVGFPLVLWVGAILHENTPWRLATIHAGDWLAKLLAVAVIVGAWH